MTPQTHRCSQLWSHVHVWKNVEKKGKDEKMKLIIFFDFFFLFLIYNSQNTQTHKHTKTWLEV